MLLYNPNALGPGPITSGPLLVSGTTSTTNPPLNFNDSGAAGAFGATVAGSYMQVVVQNQSASNGASGNYVVTADNGTATTHFIEIGANSSVFSAGTPADFFSFNNGFYVDSTDGDLAIGTTNGYKTYFVWGNPGANAHVINTAGALGFSTNRAATVANSGTIGFGTAGQVLVTAGSGAAPAWASTATQTAFTNSGTFTKSSKSNYVAVLCIGGGGGGGFGGTYAAAGGGSGGGGGAGAGWTFAIFNAADIGVSETVTVGAAGAGGQSGVTPTGGSQAGQGARGGISIFGTTGRLFGGGGGGGAPGSSATASGGGGGAIAANTQRNFGTTSAGGTAQTFGIAGGFGANGSTTSVIGSGGAGSGGSATGGTFLGGSCMAGPSGGGCGGGFTAGTAQSGGAGGFTIVDGAVINASAGSVSGNGNPGTSPALTSIGPFCSASGASGGGAGSAAVAGGGTGGTGARGSGGGGGGAGNSTNSFVGGNGGPGGGGAIYVWEW